MRRREAFGLPDACTEGRRAAPEEGTTIGAPFLFGRRIARAGQKATCTDIIPEPAEISVNVARAAGGSKCFLPTSSAPFRIAWGVGEAESGAFGTGQGDVYKRFAAQMRRKRHDCSQISGFLCNHRLRFQNFRHFSATMIDVMPIGNDPVRTK